MKMLGKERLESDVFFSSSSAWRNSVIPSITRILVAFTSCFNPRKWISQDGFLLLFGKLSHVVISFFFSLSLSLSFLFLHRGKKVVLSPGHERTDTKRKTKRKEEVVRLRFSSLAAITGIIYQVSGTSKQRDLSSTRRREEETDIDLLRWRARDNCNNKWAPR